MTCTRYDKKAGRSCGGTLSPHPGTAIAGNRCESCGGHAMGSARPWRGAGQVPTTVGEACNGCVDGHMGRDGDWLACSARCGARQVWSDDE